MKLKRENIQAIYPLLPNQEAFWLAHQHAQQDPGCLQATYRLKGELDRAIFEQALESVFAQHAMLRAIVQPRPDKSPLLVVSKEGSPSLEYHDLREAGGGDQRSTIESVRQVDLELGIDLSSLPPCRFHLFQTAEDRYELQWTFHHLFIDGWSSSVVVRDLLLQYDRLLQGLSPKPSLAKVSDFISWQKTKDKESEKHCWDQQLLGYRGLPKLSSASNQFGGIQKKVETGVQSLGPKASAALFELSKSQNLTAASIAAGVWAISVSQLYDRQDVAFGVTVAGRSTPLEHAQDMVGLFANVVPMRQRLADADTVKDVLRSVRNQQFQIQEFEHSPLGEISANRKLDRGNTLFESLLVIENYPSFQTDGSLELVDFESGLTTSYPLTICVIPSNDWSVKAVFDPQVVDAKVAEEVVSGFVSSLRNLSEVLDRSINDLHSSLPVSAFQTKSLASTVSCVADNNQPDTEIVDGAGNPRNKTELELTMIWEKILGLTEVRYNDNFFAIGGNSLTASRLMVAIEASFGKSLSPSVLIEHPSVELLASVLKSESAVDGSGVIVRFNQQQTGRPLVCVNVGVEPVTFYRHLAGYFEERPVFGTQSRGLVRFEKPYATVEAAAADFIAKLDQQLLSDGVSNDEPWDLVAYCAGCSVAFEMVRQLEASKRNVGSLTIVDSGLKYPRAKKNLSYFKRLHPNLANWLPRYLRHQYHKWLRHPMVRIVRPILANHAPRVSTQKKFRIEQLRYKTVNAYFEYQIGQIATPMMLIRSTEYAANSQKDFHLELKKHSVDKQLRVEQMEAKHETILLEPSVADVAKRIIDFSQECLGTRERKKASVHSMQ